MLHHGIIDWLNTQHKGLISLALEARPPPDFVEKGLWPLDVSSQTYAKKGQNRRLLVLPP